MELCTYSFHILVLFCFIFPLHFYHSSKSVLVIYFRRYVNGIIFASTLVLLFARSYKGYRHSGTQWWVSMVEVQAFRCPWPSCRTEGSKSTSRGGSRFLVGKDALDFNPEYCCPIHRIAVLWQKCFDIEKYLSNHSADRSMFFHNAG